MNSESEARFGVTLRPTGSMSSYRTLSQQQYLYNLYRQGRGNLAAYPGSSNHGWGLAIDLQTQQMRSIINQIGEKYGFAKRWSDAPSEWWHIKWKAGVYRAVLSPPYGHRTLKPGAKGKEVLTLKRLLHKRGSKGFKRFTLVYGPDCVAAVQRVQKKHGLRADGIVGPKTWKLLVK